MIPESEDFFSDEETTESYELLPTKTYNIDWENKRIIGMVDGREAVLQFIRKVFNTDKYAFEIYDWYYGNEILRLLGHPYEYVVTRLPKICKETLLVDDRIIDVRDFTFSKTQIDSMVASFIVDTVYGVIKYEQEIPL